MKLSLLVLALLSTTELFGYRFQYAGTVTSNSFKVLSGNLTPAAGGPATEIVFFQGISRQDQKKMIFDYSIFASNPELEEGKVDLIRVARWMIDLSTPDIVQAIGNNKGEVIGRRSGTVAEDNPVGMPFTIETSDTKLEIDSQYDPETQTISIEVTGEKILKDGRVIKWEDQLGG